MRYNVTPEDFLKGGLADLGWHPAFIKEWDDTKVSGDKAKNPGSQYTRVVFEIAAGPSKGKVAFTNFSEVAPAFIVPLLEALGQTFDKKKGAEFEITRAAMEGKRVDIHLVAGSYNNKPTREVDAYRKYSGPAVDVTAQAGV